MRRNVTVHWCFCYCFCCFVWIFSVQFILLPFLVYLVKKMITTILFVHSSHFILFLFILSFRMTKIFEWIPDLRVWTMENKRSDCFELSWVESSWFWSISVDFHICTHMPAYTHHMTTYPANTHSKTKIADDSLCFVCYFILSLLTWFRDRRNREKKWRTKSLMHLRCFRFDKHYERERWETICRCMNDEDG